MGSKSKICEKVCRLFPRADNFYDLFGGGFSITHFMLKHRSRDYKEFHFNELRPGIPQLIKDSIEGKYNYDNYNPEWISREDFNLRKDSEPMVKIIWSFGNNSRSYLFGKDIEEYKKSVHMAIVFNRFDDYAKSVFGIDKFKEGYSITDKRLYLKNRIRFLNSMNRLELEQLEQLKRLEQLERLQQLYFYNGSYDEVLIKKNSVIYCDIPYQGTADYGNGFNHKKFFDWANSQSEPIFISEYSISDKRFYQIADIAKRSLLSSNKVNKLIKSEKIYVNMAGFQKLKQGRI